MSSQAESEHVPLDSDAGGQAEERLRALLRAAGGVVLVLSPECEVVDFNAEAEKLYGRGRSEVLGVNYLEEFLPESAREAVGRDIRRVLAGTPTRGFENEVIAADGKKHLFRWNVDRFLGPGGRPAGVVAVGRDLASRVRAAEHLEVERDRAQHYLDIVGVMLVALDAEGRVSMINRKGLDILGYGEPEVIGQNWFANFLPEGMREQIREVFDRMMDGEVPSVEYYENPVLTSDGRERLIAWHNSLLRDEQGQIRGTLSSGEDITESRRVLEALEESERKYRLLVENAPAAVWSSTREGSTRYISTNVREMYGYTPAEIYERGEELWFGRIHPEDVAGVQAAYERLFDSGERYDIEYRIRHKNGEWIWLHDRASHSTQEGDTAYAYGVFSDVTERKRVEAARELANERLQYLLRSSPAVIYTSKTSGDYGASFISENVKVVTGHEAHAFVDDSAFWIDHIHPDDVDRVRSELPRVFQDERCTYDYRFRTKSGAYIWMRDDMRLCRDARGNPLEIVGYWADITDRRLAEAALRESEARYRRLFEQSSDAILVHDLAGGRVVNANASACEMLGYSLEQMQSMELLEFHPSEEAAVVEDAVRRCRQQGRVRFETRLLRADGTVIDVESNASVLEPRANAILAILRDVTLRKRLEAEQRRYAEEMEAEARRAREYAELLAGTADPRGLLIGEGPAFKRVLEFVGSAGPVTSSVLILGESGTGKEVVARSIHAASERSSRPFVVLDCAALKGDLLESELFGHEKGAFTGAHRAKDGLVEVADGGTLFVDEIGEMPLQLQSKLLRVLERGEFRRVGGVAEKTVDIRVVAATNRDLAREVKARRFREDLYYRLNVLSITLPPLRERREDVPLLALHFLEHTDVTASAKKRLSSEALRRLQAYDWPGNVR